MTTETFDYVVVGGGSAGCVLASRLSEDRSATVLLLEAGHNDWSPLFRIPIGTIKIGGEYDWQFQAEPDPSRNGKVDSWAAGKVLGGGSSINAMFWARGNPRDYDSWADSGCTGWSYADVLPYFRKSETFDGGGDAFRGDDGPQHVSRLRVSHPMTDAFVAAAHEVGFAKNDDYNGGSQDGVAYAQYSQRRGLRDSTSRAYLAPARLRRNLTVRTGATVTKVVFEDARAVGLDYVRRSHTSRVRAQREIILSAGALVTPKLLLLSGLGPDDELRRHGIPPIALSPEVGLNLQEHAYAPMMFGVTVPTLNVDTSPVAVTRHGLNFVFRRRGPVTSGAVHAVAFGQLDAGSSVPQYEILFAPFGVASGTENPEEATEFDHDVHDMRLSAVAAVTVYPSLLHPRSRGSVSLRSADPFEPPVIRHQLLGDEVDVAALAAACRKVREIFGATALSRYVAHEMVPGPAVQTDTELERFLRAAAFGGFHPIATCRMGGDDRSVVDPELRVRGVEGLRVVDASVMPTLISGHTNAPTVMLAEKAADLIKAARYAPPAAVRPATSGS